MLGVLLKYRKNADKKRCLKAKKVCLNEIDKVKSRMLKGEQCLEEFYVYNQTVIYLDHMIDSVLNYNCLKLNEVDNKQIELSFVDVIIKLSEYPYTGGEFIESLLRTYNNLYNYKTNDTYESFILNVTNTLDNINNINPTDYITNIISYLKERMNKENDWEKVYGLHFKDKLPK